MGEIDLSVGNALTVPDHAPEVLLRRHNLGHRARNLPRRRRRAAAFAIMVPVTSTTEAGRTSVQDRAGRLLAAVRSPGYAVRTFLWSRAGVAVALVFAFFFFQTPDVRTTGANDGWLLNLWARADSGWFLRIAEDGYVEPNHSTAFFPVYPGLARIAGFLLGGHYVAGAVVVALAGCAAAFVLLERLGRELLGEQDGRRAVLYLALYPSTIFLGAVYSESIYLALSLAAFLLALRGRWLSVGLLAGLAILTRSAGVALLPALLLLAWQRGELRRALPRLAVVPVLFAAWPLFLWVRLGDPLLFFKAQHSGWDRDISLAGPLGGLWEGLRAGWAGVRQIAGGPGVEHNYWPGATGYEPSFFAAVNLEELAFTILLIVLAVVAWRRLGAAFGLFALASLAIPLSTPTNDFPLLSIPRFGLGVFPVFLALACLGRRPRVDRGVVIASSLLLGLAIGRWALGLWVS